MGPKRDTQPLAAGAARRSAKAPSSLKVPSPPVSDCRRCSKISDLKRQVRELEKAERGRADAALAGVPIALSSTDIEAMIKKVYHPQLHDVLAVPQTIALSTSTDPGDRLRASAMVIDRVAGKVPEKHDVGGTIRVVRITSNVPAPKSDEQEDDRTG